MDGGKNVGDGSEQGLLDFPGALKPAGPEEKGAGIGPSAAPVVTGGSSGIGLATNCSCVCNKQTTTVKEEVVVASI